ncbi:hypothetical protein A4X13_0g756 [Tilletia indica]|uniref:RRM domain-containing protein n=1 Tax=Tilletia indica TaxID=43049 RepID=A0A177TN08_9BASI|nr:hypothetical protein A4X13_0g756 [Tilletia indica]
MSSTTSTPPPPSTQYPVSSVSSTAAAAAAAAAAFASDFSMGGFPPSNGNMAVLQNLPPVSQGTEGPLSQADPRTQLYISNLPYRVRWQDLKDLFRKSGTVLRADVALTPDNRSKGHGTVLMATEEDALRAVDMFNGFTWQGRLLECRIDRSGTLMAGPGPGGPTNGASSSMTTSHAYASMGTLPDFLNNAGRAPTAGIGLGMGSLPGGMGIMGYSPRAQHTPSPLSGTFPTSTQSFVTPGPFASADKMSPKQVLPPLNLSPGMHGQHGQPPRSPLSASFPSATDGNTAPSEDGSLEAAMRAASISNRDNSTTPVLPPPGSKERDPNLLYSLLQSNAAAATAASSTRRGPSPALWSSTSGSEHPSPIELQGAIGGFQPPQRMGGSAPPATSTGGGRQAFPPTGNLIPPHLNNFHNPGGGSFGPGGPVAPQAHPYAHSYQGPNPPNHVGGPATPSAPVPLQPTSYAGRVLFVGNLPFHCQWQDLKDLFRAAGNILRADVGLGPEGRSRGFGTVLFATQEDAQNAVRIYHGYEYSGRTLKVHFDRFAHAGVPPTNGIPSTPSQYTSAFVAANQPSHPSNAHHNMGPGGAGPVGGAGVGVGVGVGPFAPPVNVAGTAAAASAAAESIRAAALVLQSQHQYAAAAEYATAAAAYAQYAQQAQAAQMQIQKAAVAAAAAQQQKAQAPSNRGMGVGGPGMGGLGPQAAGGMSGFGGGSGLMGGLGGGGTAPASNLFPFGMNPFAPAGSNANANANHGNHAGAGHQLQRQQMQQKSSSISSASSSADPFGVMRTLRDGSGSTLTGATSTDAMGRSNVAGSSAFEPFGRMAEANKNNNLARGYDDLLPSSLFNGRSASLYDLNMRSGSFAGPSSTNSLSVDVDRDGISPLQSNGASTAAALFNRRASEAQLSWATRQYQQSALSDSSGSSGSGAGISSVTQAPMPSSNLARSQFGAADQWSWDAARDNLNLRASISGRGFMGSSQQVGADSHPNIPSSTSMNPFGTMTSAPDPLSGFLNLQARSASLSGPVLNRRFGLGAERASISEARPERHWVDEADIESSGRAGWEGAEGSSALKEEERASGAPGSRRTTRWG